MEIQLTKDHVRRKLQELRTQLEEEYQVDSIAIFGSYVREQQRPDSDLDVLVTFSTPPDLFQFIRLEDFLSDELGVQVDLVMKDTLKPRLGEQILHEAVPV
jgi:predicted nucleotidyltransferase